jgi:SAM-dependent methyltransferase/uncharacterized protein YbaR (Trm112 family)
VVTPDKNSQLRCPSTRQCLTEMPISEAEFRIGGTLVPRRSAPAATGRTPLVLLRDDQTMAYPIYENIPVLMTPEGLELHSPSHDMHDARWEEAYEESEHYNTQALSAANSTVGLNLVRALRSTFEGGIASSANPESWVDSPYDGVAQLEALRYLLPIGGKCIAQLGGSGQQAMKFLLAGAPEAWLITPMIGEALFAAALAETLGIKSRLRCVVAVGEQLPISDSYFDAIYSGGCLHHMDTAIASSEICRVLRNGGRFAAVEPWGTPLHAIGTRLVGKREKNVHCKPLSAVRVLQIANAFESVEIEHHGPFLRYMALGLNKLTGRSISARSGIQLTRLDDRLPIPSRFGGSVAVLATKQG